MSTSVRVLSFSLETQATPWAWAAVPSSAQP